MLRFIFAITTFILLSTSGIFAKDLNMPQGNFSLIVNGTTGNVAVNFKDEESISFNFLSLIEKQTNGTAIDVVEPNTHSFSGFSGLNYIVSDFVNTTYQNLPCFTAEVKSSFLTNTALTTKIHYLRQEGIINIGNNLTENVQIGSVVLSVSIENWKFCANTGNTETDEKVCNYQNGTAITDTVLDFSFDIAGKKTPVLNELPARGGNYTFGESSVYVSPFYLADDSTTKTEMAVGFPTFTTADSKNTFIVRFAKAAKNLKWDSLFVIKKKDIVPTPEPTPTPTPIVPSNATLGAYSVDILGRSGKVNINYNNESRLTFEFNKLVEVFANGTEVEKKAENHTFEKFANLDFEVSNFTEGNFQNLSCISTNIRLNNFYRRTGLDASFYIFNQTGSIKTGVKVVNGSNVDVFENVTFGSVKMSLGVQNWTFCNNLGDANDEPICNFGDETKNVKTELELEVIIKSKSEGKPESTKKGNSNFFKFGNSSVSFSPYYVADEANLVMPDGYPTLVNTGNKNTFRFRFANFKNSIMWDPIFQAEETVEPTPTPTPTPTPDNKDENINKTEVILNAIGGNMNFKAFGEKNDTISDFKVKFLSIKEVDGNGNVVGKKTENHSVTDFSNVTFTIKNSNDTVFPKSNLNISLITMESSPIFKDAKLFADVYIFREDGSLTLGDKKYEVKDGDVKFDISVKKWNFCAIKVNTTDNTTSGNCPGDNNTFENGAFLDLEFAVDAKIKSSQNGEGRFTYGTSSFVVPNFYNIDDKMATMPAGYPKYTQSETQDSYVLRFTPFQNEVNYDPIVSFPVRNGGSNSTLIIIIVILAVLLLAVAVIIYCKNRSNRKHSDAIEKGNRFVDV